MALALAAMVFGGISDFVYKQGARAGVPAHRFLMVQTWTFGPAVVLYGLTTRSLVFNAAALWGCLAGIFAFTGFYNFARSLREGRVSVNAPIFRLSFVVTVVLAVTLLGEPVTASKLTGIACACGAVWLLLASTPADAARQRRRANVAPLGRVALATIAIGVANFVYKIGLSSGATSSSLLTAQACVVASLALGLVLIIDGKVRVPPGGWRHAGTAGVVLSVAFIGLTEALARDAAVVVVPIAQMGFAVAALLGVLITKEPFGGRMAFGLVASAVAMLFLARG